MNGEILGKYENQTAINCTTTCYYTIAKELFLLHAEIVATVLLEHVVFLERTFIEEHLYALAGCVFTTLVLFLNRFFTTTETSLFALLDELLDFF